MSVGQMRATLRNLLRSRDPERQRHMLREALHISLMGEKALNTPLLFLAFFSKQNKAPPPQKNPKTLRASETWLPIHFSEACFFTSKTKAKGKEKPGRGPCLLLPLLPDGANPS